MTDDPVIPNPERTDLIDTTRPHSARIWHYWLGGKDHYPVDERAGDAYARTFPGIVGLARESRYFLARAVRYLALEQGIRQYLDIGTGLPTHDNTHQVAQRAAPTSKVVYVDNDPLVLAHAHALLTSSAEGSTDYVDADMKNPGVLLAKAREKLDFTEPVGVMFMGVLGHVQELAKARSIVARVMDAVPSGSCLALNDGTNTSTAFLEAQRGYDETGADPYVLRSPAEVAGFFGGLELVEPGVVPVADWRPDMPQVPGGPAVDAYGGVGRKP